MTLTIIPIEDCQVEAVPEPECEYCEQGEKNGLRPCESLPSGALIHRMMHTVACEPNAYVPCRKTLIEPEPPEYPWSRNYDNTLPFS
jgi:hypothetical protein